MFSYIISKILQQRNKYLHELREITKYQENFISESKYMSLLRPFIINKGKRLRSIIYFNNWENSSVVSNDIKYETIALIELMHFASIIHDDVVDNNNFRRSNDSFLKKYGKKDSILYGDYILIKSINRFLELHKENDVVKNMFLKETEATAYGALLEQKLSFDSDFSDYFKVISLKTAPFFGLSAFLGKFLSTENFKSAMKSYNFGIQFGILYQAQNDINGYSFENYLDSEDFVQKNITLPIIFLKDFENQNLENLFKPNINNYSYIKNFVNSDNFKILVEKRFKNQINYLETFL